ncbi:MULTISPECIES: helix-turn-helix transcriptional regulator [unclassified Rhizobium]|uniref:helix-turn-helix transcriptional regulator n=1 Tax=unclassified Rhizobium TaxID=2613769 RepID=UPI0006F900B7|nr:MULTISPECIES: helix-turn-helix transcriptional regulator [unclassified Rhizobium]KQV35243.1 LuxR family transcriptional regulator [Rhizobium sp. Root1212]KRD25048.1 LuxR family transcriptional regulator [Rhizobium sp. Root268]
MRDPEKVVLQNDAHADFLRGMNGVPVQTEYEVLHLMRQCAAQFGFNHFMIARFPLGEHQRFAERLVLSSWPADRVRRYDQAAVFGASPLVERLRHTKLPVFDDTAGLMQPASAEKSDLSWDGMGWTLAVHLHTTYGESFIATLSGVRAAPDQNEAALIYVALVGLFEHLERTFEAGASARDKLSAREIECLRWAAAGKSSDEIAIILGISVYTVSSYFKTATRKLDAVNRMQAIARAMRLKLI